jgi:NTE family protein
MTERAVIPAVLPRRALVLGAGGALGFAWTVGALAAIEVEAGFDVRDVDLLIGTSAGSIAAALLACGKSVDEIRRHHQGTPAPQDPPIAFAYGGSTGLPPWPGFRLGSPRLLLGSVRHPRRSSPVVALTGMLPPGRGNLGPVREMVTALVEAEGAGPGSADGVRPGPADRAVSGQTRPLLWIVATDYLTGRRVVFGRDDVAASLPDAVVASCSIPAWYPPTMIGSRPYIDGGTRSNTSVDLVRGQPLDEVYVIAPMASIHSDRPRSPAARIERAIRRSITRGLLADVAVLRASGLRVVVLTPGAEDLAVIGANLMNPRRRTEVLQTSMRTAAVQVRSQLATRRRLRPAMPAGEFRPASG